MTTTRKRTREQFLIEVGEKAYYYEQKYRGCCQSTLAAIQDVFELRDDAFFRACSGLGGGIGLTARSACGGLTAGCTFMSYLVGRQREEDGSFADESGRRFKAYGYCDKLMSRFVDEYGSCKCMDIQRELMDGDFYILSNPNEFQKFCERGAHTQICPSVTSNAAQWTVEIILDNQEDFGLPKKGSLEKINKK